MKKSTIIYIMSGFFAILVFLIVFMVLDFKEINRLQHNLSSKVIRLHVLANSNSEVDQKLKLFVRDRLIDFLSRNIDFSKGKGNVLKQVNSQKDDISKFIKDQIKQKGFDYDIKVCIANDIFPNRIYDGILFPSGEYDSVRVLIGNANGENWWCVIFPPLCIVDETRLELPNEAKQELEKSLSKKEYIVATSYGDVNKMPVKLKLKVYEILKTRFYKEAWFKRVFKNI